MSQTDLATFDTKTPGDRSVMQLLYGLHTLAWFSGGVFAVIALIINYLRRDGEIDPLYVAHHNYMISTFWWTLLWLVLLSPALSGCGICTDAFAAGCALTTTSRFDSTSFRRSAFHPVKNA
jgi:uncharacterized membrane protein